MSLELHLMFEPQDNSISKKNASWSLFFVERIV
jgi:hypothetical protein